MTTIFQIKSLHYIELYRIRATRGQQTACMKIIFIDKVESMRARLYRGLRSNAIARPAKLFRRGRR